MGRRPLLGNKEHYTQKKQKTQLWFLLFFVFSLTEDAGRRGFSFWFKEGTTQKHTQSVKQHSGRPAADRN